MASANWAFYEHHFSRPRLDHYLAHTHGDHAAAMELYDWNVAASGAFWQSLSYFEVALRNAIDARMTERHTAAGRSGHWLFDDERELGRDAGGRNQHCAAPPTGPADDSRRQGHGCPPRQIHSAGRVAPPRHASTHPNFLAVCNHLD